MSLATWLCLVALNAPEPRGVDFDTEIIPVLTKSGCNAGSCHGAAAGRGGFRLSLLGANPAADHETIAHALEGRRVNLANPAASLLLAKPTGRLDHGGDVVLEEDGPGAARILEWLRAGAPRGRGRRLVGFDVSPRRHASTGVPDHVPLRAQARYDDGEREDVTAWTVFTTSDPGSVTIDAEATATIERRGQHVVVARFLDRVVPLQWNVPFADAPVDLSGEPRANFIDDEIHRVLAELRLPVSPPASDSTWLRRVCLDLTGRLPEPELVASFRDDPAPDKRARLVDRLLNSEAYVDVWTLRWARLLRIHTLPNESEGVRAYTEWLRRRIASDTGVDRIARELLTATGDAHVEGPANFGRMVTDARGQAELAGQVFLGARLGCANCHDHPLDRWRQDDYHGLAAVFARLERGRQVRLVARGAVTNPRTGEPAVPRIPGVRDLSTQGDPRAELADWLSADGSRLLARATVNRLWRFLFGRGLVEPPDDLRDSNPSTHPELLDRLADDFARNGFRMRHALRLMALSRAYARGDQVLPGNAPDDRFHARSRPRPLAPEVVADAIADVTGVPDIFEGQATGTRAVRVVDSLAPAPALDVLGRCARVGACDETGATAVGLPLWLHLLNGDLLNRKLADPRGRLHRMIAEGRSNEEIVREFLRRALAREPSDEERARWIARLAADDPAERARRLEDFAWGLLASRAFLENH